MTRKLLYNVERLFHELPDMLKPDQSLGLEKKIERMRSDISLKGTSLHWLRISLFALCLAFVLIFQVLFPITHQIPPAWGTLPGRFPLSYAASIAAGVLWFLIIVRIFLWHIFAAGFAIFPIIRGFAKSNKLWIVPNAPDGQGGLSAVGRVAFGMASALSLGTIIFIAWVFLYGVDIVALIGGGTYTLILAMVFFWPLHSTHEAMLNAKRDELEIWSHSFFREYAQVKHMLNQKSPEDADAQEAINKQMQYLSEIEKIYTSIHNMPVWPFDTATVQKFIVIASAPIASSLIHIYWPALGSGIESAIGNLAK